MRKILIFLFGIVLFCSTFARPVASKSQPAAQNGTEEEIIYLDQDAVKRFGMAIAEIKKLYVKEVNDKQLFNYAIQGILAGLDPHSLYLNEEAFGELQAKTMGEFVGLGVEITQENGLVKVISPIDDTPADKAGVKAGDYIIAINDKPTMNQSLTDVVNQMRGKKGSLVKLTVLSQNEKKPRMLTMKRDTIKIISVKSKMLEPGFGYIRISHFQQTTAKNLEKAIIALREQSGGKLKGLILDLRNNPGGLLISGVEVSDIFLDANKLGKNKTIISTKGRFEETNKTAEATPGDVLYGAPLIILINQGTASASEIVAGALQDYKRAIIMGQRSFGKGSLQTILPLDDTTGIKLTTALYYTPKGRSIQAKGIAPDIVVDDLKFQKDSTEVLMAWQISEKDLKGHLANGNTKNAENIPTPAPQSEKEKILVTSDYQLYEALQLLKSLDILNQKTAT